MHRWTVVAAFAGCHGGSPPPSAPEVQARDAAVAEPGPPKPVELGPDAACARFATLAGAGCGWTQRFPPGMRDAKICVGSLSQWLAPSRADRDKLQQIVSCWALDCDAAANCMFNLEATAGPPPPRRCGEPGTGPVVVDANAWSARRGADAKRFADVPTSVDAPIEVCGIDGEVAWVTEVTCNDGSHPFGTAEAANNSREGMGPGGRCNSILDRYTVRCPEATYQLYVDRYVCLR